MKTIPNKHNKEIIVDDEDYDRVMEYKWLTVERPNTYYAQMTRKHDRQYLHRFVLGLVSGDGKQVDHINGNGLDNRKSNLRLADHKQNGANTTNRIKSATGYIGVYHHHYGTNFIARIRANGKKKHLGCFDIADAAARAYDAAAKELFGEFAQTNF